MRSLNSLINDSVYDPKGVEIKLNAVYSAIGNLLVLFIKVVEELSRLDHSKPKLHVYLRPAHSVYQFKLALTVVITRHRFGTYPP